MTRRTFGRIICALLAIALIGCIIYLFTRVNELSNNPNLAVEPVTTEAAEKEEKRFEVMEKGNVDAYNYLIISDTSSGVNYLVLEKSSLGKLSITALPLNEKNDIAPTVVPWNLSFFSLKKDIVAKL